VTDTIFALSSGPPPAAISVIRISGPGAGETLRALAGTLPQPRRASLRRLRDRRGETLDHALVLWFPGPATATGEDLAEFHLHGGKAVVNAVEGALAALPGVRRAEPGEFTRRAFAHGRIDLAEAEGLADLLSAETELQRQQAIALAGGALSAAVVSLRDEVLSISAAIEAALDFADEDEVGDLPADSHERLSGLSDRVAAMLSAPRAEPLREGFRVVLAGPPNAGKSSLFNRLVEDEAAITAPLAGTTRDVLTRPIAIAGIPFLFADTAGLREDTQDSIEAIGIARARSELSRADLVLWLGPEGQGTGACLWEVESFADRQTPRKDRPRHRVSAVTGEGVEALRTDLIAAAREAMPNPGVVALNRRQHDLLRDTKLAIDDARTTGDPLLVAEGLRSARAALDRLLGRAATEDMLDTLFGRFCIGK
jgi:tRNA modification GTPase